MQNVAATKALKVKSGYIGFTTGNGKKLSSIHAQLGQATCLVVAYLLSISCVSILNSHFELYWVRL